MRTLPRILIALSIFAVLLPGVAVPAKGLGAITKEWTTTSDFDSGTKSQTATIPADAAYEIESRTDNLAVAANEIKLGSKLGDNFPLNDSDANTWKWSATVSGATVNEQDISGGVMILNLTSTGASGVMSEVSTSTYSGDLDIRIKITYRYKSIATPTNSWSGILSLVNEKPSSSQGICGQGGPATMDGVLYRYLESGNGATKILAAYTCTNNVLTQVGASTTYSPDPRWLRITRVGTQANYYYSANGTAWTLDKTTTFATSENLYIQFGMMMSVAGGDKASASFDDVHMAQGTVALGGFKTSGIWTSPIYAIGGNYTVEHVALSVEGLSSDYYISSVVLLQNGSAKWSWLQNLVSGTLILLNVSASVSYNVTLQITLKGIGAGTATVTAIGLALSVAPASSVVTSTDTFTWLWLMAALWLALTVIGFVAEFGPLAIIGGIIGIGFSLALIAASASVLISVPVAAASMVTILLGVAVTAKAAGA